MLAKSLLILISPLYRSHLPAYVLGRFLPSSVGLLRLDHPGLDRHQQHPEAPMRLWGRSRMCLRRQRDHCRWNG